MTRFSNTPAPSAIEVDQMRRALAGDAAAKRSIEARDLMAKADRTTSDLRLLAAKGDQAAMATLRNIANGGIPTTIHAAAPSNSAADRAAGGYAERQRFATVFADARSHGRERGLVNLLASERGWSAAAIIAQLDHLPMDGAAAPRAIAPSKPSKPSKSQAAQDAAWDRAHGNARVEASKPAPLSHTDAAWARAHAKAGPAAHA